MKKLRLIVTSVIVLAIVGSAFAFKVKGAGFCVLLSSTGGTNCTTYLLNRQISTVGSSYKYNPPQWDGNKITCTAANNGKCTSMTTLQFEGN